MLTPFGQSLPDLPVLGARDSVPWFTAPSKARGGRGTAKRDRSRGARRGLSLIGLAAATASAASQDMPTGQNEAVAADLNPECAEAGHLAPSIQPRANEFSWEARLLDRTTVPEVASGTVVGNWLPASPPFRSTFCRTLATQAGVEVRFRVPVRVNVADGPVNCTCTIADLSTGEGPTQEAAIADAIVTLKSEVMNLLGRLTHELTPAERARKKLLLGSVDIVRSAWIDGRREHTWVLGRVVPGPRGQIVFKAVGPMGAKYRLTPELVARFGPGNHLRFARVKTGPAGEPRGPVDKLEPPLNPGKVQFWEEWLRRAIADNEKP